MKKWNSQQDCWEGSLSGRPSSHFPQSASLTLSLAQLPTHVQGLCPGFGDVARRGGQGLWPITAYFWVIELVELVRDHCSVCKSLKWKQVGISQNSGFQVWKKSLQCHKMCLQIAHGWWPLGPVLWQALRTGEKPGTPLLAHHFAVPSNSYKHFLS